MITGFHHFAIIVSSEKSVEFYTRLGFEEFYRKDREHDTVVLLKGYGSEIEMFIDPSHPSKEDSVEPLGIRHICLAVENIEETVEKLSLEHTPIKNDWIGRKYCYLTDPDGNKVELHE